MSQELLICIAVTMLFFIVILGWFVRKLSRPTMDHALSPTEQMFSAVLEKAVGGRYEIHCKVPLIDVLEPLSEISERAKRRAVKPVKPYQFDYLVCERDTGKVVCAVELDDHSFDIKRFQKKDMVLEEICQSVSLPLLRVAPQNGYNLVEIIERFERTIEPQLPAEAPVYTAHQNLQLCDRFLPVAA